MTELQVPSKDDGLSACGGGDCLEDSIGNGLSWKQVATNKLMNHLQGYILIGDGLKYRKGNGKSRCQEDTNNRSPYRELSGNDSNGYAKKGKGNNTDNSIPPHRNFWVEFHETRMNIIFILQSVAESADNILPEPY